MPAKTVKPAVPVYELESSSSEDEQPAATLNPAASTKQKRKCTPEILARLEKARAAKKLLQEPSIKAKELERKRKELKYAANAARVKQLEEEVARLQTTPQKKPKKQKRLIVEESSSSEEEVVVRRKPRQQAPVHHQPQQAAQPPPYNTLLFGRYD